MSGIAGDRQVEGSTFNADAFITTQLTSAEEPVIHDSELTLLFSTLGTADHISIEPIPDGNQVFFVVPPAEYSLSESEWQQDTFPWKWFDSCEEVMVRSIHTTDTWGIIMLIIAPAEEVNTYYVSLSPMHN